MIPRFCRYGNTNRTLASNGALLISVCTLCALFVGLFIGCGGSGNHSVSVAAGNQTVAASVARASGHVILPTGFKLSPASLTVRTGIDAAPLNSNGTFSVRVIGGGPTIASVEDKSGNVVLMGYVDGANSGSPQAAGNGEISPTQCAVALLFFAVGAWDVDPSNGQAIRDAIGQAPQTAQLASTIASRIVADPLAVTDGDAQIVSALQQAAQAIGPPPSKAVRRLSVNPPASRVVADTTVVRTRDASSGGILIDPSGVTQSGVDVNIAPDNAGVIFVNNFRRRCTAFVYETAAVDANGNSVVDASTLPKPITVPQQGLLSTIETQFKLGSNPQSNFEIGTSNALNGVVGSVVDKINDQGAFTSAATQELTLAPENGAVKTTYRIIVVGPAFTQQNQVSASALAQTGAFAKFAPQWQNAVDGLFYEEVILDGALPLFSSFVFGEQTHVQIGKLKLNSEAIGAIQELADAMSGLPDVNTAARNGDYAGALKSLAQLVADSGAVQESMAKLLLSQIIFTGPPDIIVPQTTALQKIEQQLSHFSNWASGKKLGTFSLANVIAYADAILFGLDLTVIIHDGIAAFPVVAWDVTLTSPKVTLTPATATVNASTTTAALSGTPIQTGSSGFIYHWNVSGNAGGGIEDSKHTTGKDTDFDSLSNQVTYAEGALAENGQVDTVTLQVFSNAGTATQPKRGGLLGTAQSAITVQLSGGCGGPLGQVVVSGCGNFTLSSAVVKPGGHLVVSVTLSTGGNCGNGATLSLNSVSVAGVTLDGVSQASSTVSIAGTPNGSGTVTHTVDYEIAPDSPNCIGSSTPNSDPNLIIPQINGPWVVLQEGSGGNASGWTTQKPFQIQK